MIDRGIPAAYTPGPTSASTASCSFPLLEERSVGPPHAGIPPNGRESGRHARYACLRHVPEVSRDVQRDTFTEVEV